MACDEGVVERGGEGDGEDVGGDVFDGEEAAEEDFSGEGETEGVDGCDGDETAEFEKVAAMTWRRLRRLGRSFGRTAARNQ